MNGAIKVQWLCKQPKRRCLNKTGLHEEKHDAARCVYQEEPETLAAWLEANFKVPVSMELPPQQAQ